MRPPIGSMTAAEIHDELVTDAANGYFTPIQRFIDGCIRISRLRGIHVDLAYGEIRAEALAKGAPGMLLEEMI